MLNVLKRCLGTLVVTVLAQEIQLGSPEDGLEHKTEGK